MSEFIKGLLYGSVGTVFLLYTLGKIGYIVSATVAKSQGKCRERYIAERVTKWRKYYERVIPHWEELA
jgi:hypothetical protein